MSAPAPRPPRWTRALLARLLPGSMRGEAIRGDLDEEFAARARVSSLREARAWYRRQAVRVLLHYRPGGLLTRAPRRRGRPMELEAAPLADGLWADVAYAARRLGRAPGFTLVAAGSIAFGTGATTAVFSVLDAVLLRPLPYPEAHRLVQVWETNPQRVAERGLAYADFPVNALNFEDYREGSRAFESLAFVVPYADRGTATVGGDGGTPEVVGAMAVSPSFFATLGHEPLLGRSFLEEETAPPGEFRYSAVAVLSHELWVRRFGADPDILGRTIELDAGPTVVVGVQPPGFTFPPLSFRGELLRSDVDVYLPLFYPAFQQPRSYHQLLVVGRLAPGVELAAARAEMARLADGLAREHPEAMAGWTTVLTPLHDLLARDFGAGLYTLLGTVGFVLLIACANVANLLLAQGSNRRPELAVRASVGGGRGRLVRMLLVETLLLSAVGGALGVLVAAGGTRALLGLVPADVPRAAGAAVDTRVLGFAVLLVLLTTLVAGLLPALRSSRIDLGEALKGSGRGPRAGALGGLHPSRVLVAVQVALTLVLLVGGGILGKSFLRLRSVDPGYDPERLLVVRLARGDHHVTSRVSPDDEEARRRMWRIHHDVLERVRAVPGVASAAYGPPPLEPGRALWGMPVQFRTYEGRPPEEETLRSPVSQVSPDYFRTMGIPLVRGEGLPPWDGVNDWRRYWWSTTCDAETRAYCKVVVSESFARRAWPGEDPIGKELGLYGCCWTVAGVVRDASFETLDAPAVPFRPERGLHVYSPGGEGALLVRASVEPEALVGALRAAIAQVDPQAAATVTTMERRAAEALARPRFYLLVAGLFGAVALAMALLGLYGVIAYSVSRRTREIGVRIALGADRRRVRRLVLGQAMAPVAAGLAAGLAAAFALPRVIERFLYGMSAVDPWLVAAVAGALVLSAALASWIPARRASSVEPVRALAHE